MFYEIHVYAPLDYFSIDSIAGETVPSVGIRGNINVVLVSFSSCWI